MLQDRQIASYAVPGLLVALVAERNVVFALARMWEAFIEGIGRETKIFPSLAEAQADLPPSVSRSFPVKFLTLRLLLQPARGKCLPTRSWAATRPTPPESVVDWPWAVRVLSPSFSHRSCTATGTGC